MNSIVPAPDPHAEAAKEAFKFGTKALETLEAANRAIGPLASDFVGWAFGDALKTRRWENAQRRWHEAEERLTARGVKTAVDLSPSIKLPLLEGACDEERPELSEMWARLLANALDPSRTNRVRLRFIEVIKRLDPLDALIFQTLCDFPQGGPTTRDFMAAKLRCTQDEAEVSFENLFACDLIAANPVTANGNRPPVLSNVYLTAIGRQFAAAVAQ